MRYGVREICDVVFKAKANMKIGNMEFKKGQPVLYIDSAKTSTIEGAATTVYATGGRGNTRLISWEGEKTLTFTVEDALLSPISFAILSGAGLFTKSGPEAEGTDVYVHMTANAYAGADGEIDLTDYLGTNKIATDADVFVMLVDEDGSLTGEMATVDKDGLSDTTITVTGVADKPVFVDFYIKKPMDDVHELQIDAAHFAGYYYVEANTLFRRKFDGVDAPVAITLPNVKIQSNFTFTMAATGDPSTFTFTMDAMPGYTAFDKTRQVLCVMQILKDGVSLVGDGYSVMDTATNA